MAWQDYGIEEIGFPKSLTLEAKDWLWNSYYGKQLMENHSVTEYGIWLVYGEDKNLELSGPRHIPTLGYYRGYLADVVNRAITLDDFFVYGNGGNIVKIEIKSI